MPARFDEAMCARVQYSQPLTIDARRYASSLYLASTVPSLMTALYKGRNVASTSGRCAMVAKMFGTLPARAASFSNASCNSGEACSFVRGFTTPILGLLFCLPTYIALYAHKFIKARSL